VRRAFRLALLSLSVAAPLLGADAPVARVAERAIGAAELERRARLIAPGQWAAYGRTWPERRRRFLDEVLIAEVLLELEATRAEASARATRDAALSRTLLARMAAEIAPASGAPIEQYYERHRRQFETPAAILIWRILVREEKDARDIIGQLRSPSVADFSRLARERSLDDATHMRSGSVGFVAADGQSEMPELRVAPQLFEAASKVRDGELVKEPVTENGKFAIVWRRASRPARRETLEEATPAIRRRLHDVALASGTRELIERLRREGLREHRPELVSSFEPQPAAAASSSATRGAAPAAERPVRLRPEPGDYGLR
jgi:hypothetical protein